MSSARPSEKLRHTHVISAGKPVKHPGIFHRVVALVLRLQIFHDIVVDVDHPTDSRGRIKVSRRLLADDQPGASLYDPDVLKRVRLVYFFPSEEQQPRPSPKLLP